MVAAPHRKAIRSLPSSLTLPLPKRTMTPGVNMYHGHGRATGIHERVQSSYGHVSAWSHSGVALPLEAWIV
jgi:hypothetical protein